VYSSKKKVVKLIKGEAQKDKRYEYIKKVNK